MAKLEKTLTVLLGIGILLAVFRLDGGAIISLVAGVAQSLLYFSLGFALLNGIRARQLFSGAAYRDRPASGLLLGAYFGLALSVAALAVPYTVAHWAGATPLRLTAQVALLIGLIALALLRKQLALPGNGRGWIVRGIVAILVTILLGLLPPPSPAPRATPSTERAHPA